MERSGSTRVAPDLVCLSHLRWDTVYQRPHHLMTRAAESRRVFWLEEPRVSADGPGLTFERPLEGLTVVVPHLPDGLAPNTGAPLLRRLLDEAFQLHDIVDPVLWYYTPMALRFTDHIRGSTVIYDCMDELTAFRSAPTLLAELEPRLLRTADLVFTGGHSLYESKRRHHPRCHPFPSSVDVRHFARGREQGVDPPDQERIGHPRAGYCGVIDERIDLELIQGIADARPELQLVLLGPVQKLRESALPQAQNIHYLGRKGYQELPAYLAGWDVALMPFAHNDATRFISPTKTPEYLAAGRRVVSTAVRDVVRPYGELGLVAIADGVDAFLGEIDRALDEERPGWLQRVDRFLDERSWDRTWRGMSVLLEAPEASDGRRHRAVPSRIKVGPDSLSDATRAADGL